MLGLTHATAGARSLSTNTSGTLVRLASDRHRVAMRMQRDTDAILRERRPADCCHAERRYCAVVGSSVPDSTPRSHRRFLSGMGGPWDPTVRAQGA
jgi:hypothetical protein